MHRSCIEAVLSSGADMSVPPPPVAPLASIRKRKLLSQRALATRAGVALSTIYLLEAGKTERATFKVMRAVSDALGVLPESIAEFRRAMDAEVRSDPVRPRDVAGQDGPNA
jgi:transcriptional regulator with XRE-family HTH domain